MKNIKSGIFKQLKSPALKKSIPFHMPGHKRNISFAPYLKELSAKYDITEIQGYDNLQCPNGIILNAMKNAQQLWKTMHSFLLVNGSTCGILAAINTTCQPGDKIVIARNCHKSVYNAVELLNLKPVFIHPKVNNELQICGSVDSVKLSKIIKENKDIKAVVITSPTYDGVISDISAICTISHENNIPVIVDEAHGAHLALHERFNNSAVTAKTDIVIHSLHKTLPSLTQTAVAHLCTDRINPEKFLNSLSIFQTSSPSYLLLSSIDCCINLLNRDKDEIYKKWLKTIDYIDNEIASLKNLFAFYHGTSKNRFYENIYSYDRSKLLISVKNNKINGKQLFDILYNDYNIVLEMYSDTYVIAMLSMCDKKRSLKKLMKALHKIDNLLDEKPSHEIPYTHTPAVLTESVMGIRDAKNRNSKIILVEKSEGHISNEFIWAYPPGIPYLIPGEIITSDIIVQIKKAIDNGIDIKSDLNHKKDEISVIN